MSFGVRYAPLGYAQMTGFSSAAANLPTVGSPSAIPSGAEIVAQLQAEAQNVRWRDDGTDPTSTVGNLIVAGTTFEYSGNLAALRVIGATSGAILNVGYYRLVG